MSGALAVAMVQGVVVLILLAVIQYIEARAS
jgi:hypothetical protein